MSRASNLLDIWDLYSTKVITEKTNGNPPKRSQKFSTKPGPGPKLMNDKDAYAVAQHSQTGPDGVNNFDGPAFNRNISDLKTMTDKDKEERPYVADLNVSVENFDKEIEKTTKSAINNNMKSTFDKLFEEVMNSEDEQDLAALGVDTETGDMGGEEVTITLKPEHVQLLKDILAQVEGGAEDMEADVELGDETTPDDNLGTEEDAEEHGDKDEEKHDEDSEEVAAEATHMEEVPDQKGLHLTKVGNNKVGDVTAKNDVGAGPAGTKTIKDGVDGKGKDVPSAAGMNLTKLNHNKPNSKIKGNNQLAFGIK
jgi:hypothetical protein